MDLRQFNPTPEQVEAAALYLRYQPFVIDHNRRTGVAHAWLYSRDPRYVSFEDFFFDRGIVAEEVWNAASDANSRLARMYDAFIARIVDICPPGGSYLDVACNTGYFPVRASLSGIQTAVGTDLGDYSTTFQLLNEITGSAARFTVGNYDSLQHSLTMKDNFGLQRYDVVSSSSFLCHVSDPLHFLKAVGDLASKAVFLWSGFVESEELIIRYNTPNRFSNTGFPNGYDDGTSISLGLLYSAMASLGFPHREELKSQSDWLPEDWHLRGIPHYQKFRAFVFWR